MAGAPSEADAGTLSLSPSGALSAAGVYGSIAVAVACVAWNGDDERRLAVAVVGYSLTLWLAHVYAWLIPGGEQAHTWASLGYFLRLEWPHLAAALPALVAIGIGAALNQPPVRVSDVAAMVTVIYLIGWQFASLRPRASSKRTLIRLTLVDLVALGLIIALRVFTK